MADDEPSIPVHTGIITDYHPDTVKGTSPATTTTQRTLEPFYEDLGKILDAEKQIKNKLDLAKHAKPLFDKIGSRLTDAIGRLDLQRDTAAKALHAKLTEGKNAPQAAEIRAHFKNNSKSPLTELTMIIRSGDGKPTAAILGAPPFLSGLTDEQAKTLRELAEQKLEPDLQTHVREAEANIGKLMRAQQYVGEMREKKMRAWTKESDDAAIALLTAPRKKKEDA